MQHVYLEFVVDKCALCGKILARTWEINYEAIKSPIVHMAENGAAAVFIRLYKTARSIPKRHST
jgi:hypothetical protein